MISKSYQFAAQAFKARQLIEARTGAESIRRATDKALSQGGHLISPQEVHAIRSSLEVLSRAEHGEDHRAIRQQISEMEKMTHHLAEVLMDTSLKEALQNKKLADLT